MPRLTPSQQRRILQEAMRQFGSRSRNRWGLFGKLLGLLADILSEGHGPSRRDIQDAIEILTEQGFEVQPGGPPGKEILEPPVQAPPVSRGGQNRTSPTRRRPAGERWPEEHTIQPLPTRIRGAFENIPSDIDDFSAWVLTPQSSNVYAVAFDYGSGILYVQYRAEGEPIGYKESISICSGKAYKVGIRPNIPGPIYSYGGAGRPVPEEIFNELARSRSPGKVVWDQLRECGSQWQHKFPYTLTDVPVGQNIPRKATRRGLRVRNVPVVGSGRRGPVDQHGHRGSAKRSLDSSDTIVRALVFPHVNEFRSLTSK